jgi:hypothetical protein
MSQPNVRSEGNARSGGRGGVASKSREAAERIENSVSEGVERVRSQADDAKEHAAERIRRVATQLRSMGESLRADDAVAGSLADRASRSIESAADYVSSMDARSAIRDTEQLARQRPALFYGGAFLLGLAAGRFFRSSAPQSGGYGADRERFDQRRFDQRRSERSFEENERPESRYGSEQRGEGWPSAGDEAERRNQRSEERFRQNYDATFGRDAPGQGAPNRASSSPVTSGGPSPSRSTTTEGGMRHGVIDPTKGSGT